MANVPLLFLQYSFLFLSFSSFVSLDGSSEDWRTDSYRRREKISEANILRVGIVSLGTPLVPQRLKHLPAMRETWVRSLDWEDRRRKWQPTAVFLPGESHGRRSLVGYSPRGHKESDTTERLVLLFYSLIVY